MRLTMLKWLGMSVFFVAILSFTGMVHAQMMGHEGMMMGPPGKKGGMEHRMGMGGYGGGYGGGPFDIDMLKEHLKLNDDQVEKLKKIQSDYRKEMIKRRANLRIAMLELWELIDAKNLDMAKVEKKVKEVEAMQSDLMLYRVRTLQETRKFLTDEQYEHFREMGFKTMRRMMQHGMMGGMGPGMMEGGMMGGPMGGGMMGPMHDDSDD